MVKPIDPEIIIAFRTRGLRKLSKKELESFFRKLDAYIEKINTNKPLNKSELFTLREYAIVRDLAYLFACIASLQESHIPITGYTLADCISRIEQCENVKDFYEPIWISASEDVSESELKEASQALHFFNQKTTSAPESLEDFFKRLRNDAYSYEDFDLKIEPKPKKPS